MMTGFIVTVVFSLFANVFSERIFILDEPLSTETVSLAHLHPQFRQKRSTDSFSFPQEIELKFPLGGNHVNIPLERRQFRGIPNVIIGGVRESNYGIAKTHALYQNPEQGAAITMRCKDLTSESCEMYGTFYHEKGLYQIQPINTGIYSEYEVSRIKGKNRPFSDVSVPPEKLSKIARSRSRSTKVQSRRKRAVDDPTPPAYVAELYLSIDYALTTRIINAVGNDSNNFLLYAVGVTNEIDTRTRNIRVQFIENRQGRLIQDFDLGVMLTTTEICYDPSSCTWSSGQVTNGVLDENSLQAFSTSISGLTGFDFAVGLTTYDTTDGNHPGLDLAGIYYTEGDICISNDLSLVSSITEANTGGAGFHIAHFLGRHLGSLGDGEPGVLCAVENFIMSPTWDSSLASVGTLSNPYRWSICSLGYLFTRIQESFTTNNLNCLKVNSFPDTDYTNNRNFPDLGQDFNLTAQCQIALGDTSTFCGMQQESLCWEGALCTNAANGLACDVTIQVLDGTPCYPAGVTYPDKICVSGECVTGTTTTSTPTTTTPTPTTTTSTPTTTRPTPTTTTTTSIPTTTTTISTTSTTSTTTPITTTTSTTTPATTTPITTTPSTTTPSTTTPSTTTPSTTTPITTTPSTTTPATTTPSTTTTSTTTPATTTTSTTTPSTTTTSITTPATTTTSTTTPATTTTSTTTPATTTTSTTTPLTTSTSTISSSTTTPSTTTTSNTTPSTTTPLTTTTSTTTPSTTTPSTTTTSNTTPSTTTTSITTPSTTTTSITTPTTTTTSTTTPSTTTTSTTTPATTTTSTTTPSTTTNSTTTPSTTTPATTTTSTTTPTTTTTSISTPTTTTPSMPTTPFLTTTQDLDRCREVGLICDPNARCIKEAGQFVCRCNPPYEGNGEFCVFDNCAIPGLCDINADCINTIESYVCVCRRGFIDVDSKCLAKECVDGTSRCSPNANCITIPGSYKCECKSGYEGDGFTCVAVTPPTPPGPAIQRYQDTSMLGRTYRSTNYEQIPIGKQYPDPNLYPTADPSYPTGNTFSPYPSTVSYYPGTPAKSAKSSKKKGKSSKSKKSSKSRSSFSMMDPFMNGPANMFQTYQKHWSL